MNVKIEIRLSSNNPAGETDSLARDIENPGRGASGADCRKTSLKMSVTEQRGKCEGGKKPPSRSIDTYF